MSAGACGASRGGQEPAEPPAPPKAATRALPAQIHPGDTVTVSLEVHPPAGATDFAVRAPLDAGGPGKFTGSARWEAGSRPVEGGHSLEVVPRDGRPPAGETVLRRAAGRSEPLGIGALDALSERLSGRPLRAVVSAQNDWARHQIDAYRSAPPVSDYRLMLAPFVEGPGGLRRVFAPAADGHPTAWARSQIGWLGPDAFTRLTAFLEGFPPGSDAFRMVFGGTRRPDAEEGGLVFLGSELEAAGSDDADGGAPAVNGPAARSRYAAAVRRTIFDFYRRYRDGRADAEAVRRFNRAMVIAGGPALVAWGAVPRARSKEAADTAAAGTADPAGPIGLNRMASVLEELGHEVRLEPADGAPGADALAALDSALRRRAPRTAPTRRAGGLSIASRGHLPTAKIGTPYAHALDVDGGRPPYVWMVGDGWLPDGMRLDRERGRVVGVPEETGLFNFTLSVMGNEGATARKPFALAVAEATAGILVAKTEQVHDGEPKQVAVRTSPPGLEVSVTYNGAREPPTKPGEYAVSVRVIQPGYRGTAKATLRIRENDPTGDQEGSEHR